MALSACGGPATIGPSPVAPPAGTVATAVPGAAPRSGITSIVVPGVAPELVTALLFGAPPNDNPHALEAWENAALRHCVGPGLDVDQVAAIVASGAAVSGIPAAVVSSDTCDVRWVREAGPGCGLHPCTAKTVEGGRITAATIYVPEAGRLTEAGLHELGHALGLGHSPRRGDLMAVTPTALDFSADERAVIAAVYR